jgi:hypothetical protein
MLRICQIALMERMLPTCHIRVANLFLTDDGAPAGVRSLGKSGEGFQVHIRTVETSSRNR